MVLSSQYASYSQIFINLLLTLHIIYSEHVNTFSKRKKTYPVFGEKVVSNVNFKPLAS